MRICGVEGGGKMTREICVPIGKEGGFCLQKARSKKQDRMRNKIRAWNMIVVATYRRAK